MLIGLMSDTHDNLATIRRALAYFDGAGADCLIHAGDFVAPFALKEIVRYKGPVYGVFGNNDGERAGLTKLLKDLEVGPRRLDVCARVITVVHDEKCLRKKDLAKSDVIVVGHTHKAVILGGGRGPMFINPGECGGWVGGEPTVATLDTESLEAKIVKLGKAW